MDNKKKVTVTKCSACDSGAMAIKVQNEGCGLDKTKPVESNPVGPEGIKMKSNWNFGGKA